MHDINEIRQALKQCRGTVGLVPSLGNFHVGHQSLFRKSVADNALTVVCTVLVPIVFNDYNDFLTYPKTPEEDLKKVDATGADILFIPDPKALFPGSLIYTLQESQFSNTMEGLNRPGHFNGALTVILKLLLLLKPDNLYLGEKDYQQLELVQGMCKEFYIDTKIISCPIVRTKSGLAYSSRNSRLSLPQQAVAASFPKILKSLLPIDETKKCLEDNGFKVDYIEDYNKRRYGAVILDSVRLIDNVELP